MKRGAVFLLVCCLLCLAGASALADLKRGSSGDDVKRLQQQMIEIGALDDAADGVFGKKTEKAVKDLQAYFGMKKTGRANDSFLEELSLLRHALDEEETGSGELSEKEMEARYTSCCPADPEIEYCPRHQLFPYLESLLERNGRKAPAGVRDRINQRITELAYRETIAMYGVWESRLKNSQKHIAREQRKIYEDSYAEFSADVLDYYRNSPRKAWEALKNWTIESLVNECYDLYGQEPNPG